MSKIRGAALNVNNYSHHTDHLAGVAAFMGCPLLFTNEDDVEFAKKWYPGVDVRFEEWSDVNPAYYAEHYDVLFHSDLFRKDLFKLMFKPFENGRKRPLRNVHVPHGFSDKGFWFSHVVDEDITLIYGENMLDLLKACGVRDNLGSHVVTGNYRYTYYKKNKDYLDQLLKKEVLSKFEARQPRRNILYAPTWKDSEKSSSFFSIAPILFDQLDPHDNLIVKLHPNLMEENLIEVLRIIGLAENKPNVVVLDKFPPVYPLLAYSDVYIGDMSSVGYDYLAFNRPMFFLNERRRDIHNDRGLYLYRCGTEVQPEKYENIYKIIENALSLDNHNFSDIRNQMYQYSFGEEKSFEKIKGEVEWQVTK